MDKITVDAALAAYIEGEVTLGRAAELAGVHIDTLVTEARTRGIEPRTDAEMLAEDLAPAAPGLRILVYVGPRGALLAGSSLAGWYAVAFDPAALTAEQRELLGRHTIVADSYDLRQADLPPDTVALSVRDIGVWMLDTPTVDAVLRAAAAHEACPSRASGARGAGVESRRSSGSSAPAPGASTGTPSRSAWSRTAPSPVDSGCPGKPRVTHGASAASPRRSEEIPMFTDSDVCPVIGAFLRRWSADLPSDTERTRFALDLDLSVLDWQLRKCVPAWLDLMGLERHAITLRALAPIVDGATLAECLPGISAIGASVESVVEYAARDVARAFALAAETAATKHESCAHMTAARRGASSAGQAANRGAVIAAWVAAGPSVARLQESAGELVRRMAAVQRLGPLPSPESAGERGSLAP